MAKARDALRLLQGGRWSPACGPNPLSNSSVLGIRRADDLVRWSRASQPNVNLDARRRLGEALIEDNRTLRRERTLHDAVRRIETGGPVVVVSHQPTTLPYSGVYAQFALASFIA